MKIEIEFNKPLDQEVLSQFDPELLKEDLDVIYQLQKTLIIIQGEFKIDITPLFLWITSKRNANVYCVFNMTDVLYLIVKHI